MLASLLARFVAPCRLFARLREVPAASRFERPQLETLEDRLVLSETTSIPAFADIPSIIAIPDVLMASLPKGNPSVIFLGDSIGYGFAYGTGSAVWSAFFAPLGAADFAVSGQTTESLLYQLSLGQLAGIQPSVVVLDIGANNLLHGDSPQDTAAGVLANVNTIHQDLPLARVLVLAILPGKPSPTDPFRSEGTQTNALLAQSLASDPFVSFVDLGSLFLQADGTISTAMMYDYLHPTALGYLEMTSELLPALEQIGLPNVTLPSFGPLALPTIPASQPPTDVTIMPS
jgi:lysophospholipase L1-like esterase